VSFDCVLVVTNLRFIFVTTHFGIKKVTSRAIASVQKIARIEKKNILRIDGTTLEGSDQNIEMMYNFITALWEKEKEKEKKRGIFNITRYSWS